MSPSKINMKLNNKNGFTTNKTVVALEKIFSKGSKVIYYESSVYMQTTSTVPNK